MSTQIYPGLRAAAGGIRCRRTEDFAGAAGRAGIGPEVFVIAYGNGGGAERLWWLLRHFGHDACGVVEFEAWHGPLERGESQADVALFTARPRDDDTIEAEELDRRRAELVVIDARQPARWRGEPNPIDQVPGRIPGAVNAPWNEPLPDLPGGEIVAYCGSGVTATWCSIGSTSRATRESSTRARGASGSNLAYPSSASSCNRGPTISSSRSTVMPSCCSRMSGWSPSCRTMSGRSSRSAVTTSEGRRRVSG